ncbi:MAG: ParA family protein [Actinobacteria bacterium]|nr:ParA family protein [Actinomycetota bacterium]
MEQHRHRPEQSPTLGVLLGGVQRPRVPANGDQPHTGGPDKEEQQVTQTPTAPTEIAPSAQEAQPPGYSTEGLLERLQPPSPPKARRGWRAWLGLRPSAQELEEQRRLGAVRTNFARPITIMVANPKGGAGKTPISLLLAGEIGEARGGSVVVWDNNELRGNARDRSYCPHRRNVADLLAAADSLDRPEARFVDLAVFLSHQTPGKYHVLSSDQSAAEPMDEEKFKRVHRILSRFFAVIIVDTGNNEKASNWLAALQVADAMVVPAKWRHDSILGANRMLESLADQGHEILGRTLIVGTNGPGDSQKEPRAQALAWFGQSHQVVEVPTDPHIHAGTVIDRRRLTRRTRRVGLQAAAVASELAAQAARRPPESGLRAPASSSSTHMPPMIPLESPSELQSGVAR